MSIRLAVNVILVSGVVPAQRLDISITYHDPPR